ncbi:hypothetical protein EV175_003356 [Coemansia sp. RSA 1933]|nr:hypothetical protein EV175_003356 [Coemansia sp. RSA 1933]
MALGGGLFSREASSRRGSDQSITGSSAADTTEEEITHFAILVPGTGPHREDEKPKGMFLKKAQKFRTMLKDTCRREFASTKACVEMEPIEFHADMHALASANPRMDSVTLPSIPWIRTLDNEVIGDILYYFSSYHGHRMLDMVIRKINDAYRTFMEQHPRFKGHVNLIAHSLGGLICYEILYLMDQRKKKRTEETASDDIGGVWEASRYRGLPDLAFTPNRLFTMGSPLGGTVVFRNLSFDEYLIGNVGYHNIFHPYDPFGYRTEPLVDGSYADRPAVPITGSADKHADESLLDERDGGAMAPRSGGGSHFRQNSLLSGYMTGIGRTVVDAVVVAPIAISSTMLRAAKSTVAVPVNAMARRMSSSACSTVLDADPQRLTSRRHRRRRMSVLLGVSSAKKGEVTAREQKAPAPIPTGRKSFSWIVPSFDSGSKHSAADDHHKRRTSLSRLLNRNCRVAGDKSPGSTLRPSEANGSSDSSNTQMSLMSKQTTQADDRSPIVYSPTPLEDDDGEESSGSSERQYPCSPLVAAAVGAMATSDTAQSTTQRSATSSSSSSMEGYSMAPASQSLAPQNRSMYETIDTDDMVNHIMRIFSLSRPPGKRQQMAEAQGLPLSSHLLSSHHHRYGVPLTASLTTPYTNDNMAAHGHSSVSDIGTKGQQEEAAQPNSLADVSNDHSGTLGSRSPQSSDGEHTVAVASLRRSNTLPLAVTDGRHRLRASSSANKQKPHNVSRVTTESHHNPPELQKAHTAIGNSSSDNTTATSRSSPPEEPLVEGEENGTGLPYLERMDYIIPFTKGHLQNEYWLGFQSHFSYWTSKEVVYHILYHMVSKPYL